MTPQERDLITTLLTRLQGVASQPKDPEAEGLIRQAVAAQPDAPYYLVQTALIQDLSLHSAQNRIAELEQQLGEAKAARQAPTSFLGNLFGHREAQPLVPASGGGAPGAGPWGRAPQVASAPGYGQPGYGQQGFAQPGYGQSAGAGGGFLRSAAATAAGVAGGALLFEGIESLFGQHYSNSLLGGQSAMPGLGESVVNNYYGDSGQGQDFGSGQDSGAGQDFGSGQDSGPGQDDGSGQDFGSGQDGGGGDFGGGGDSGGGDFGGGDFGGGDVSC